MFVFRCSACDYPQRSELVRLLQFGGIAFSRREDWEKRGRQLRRLRSDLGSADQDEGRFAPAAPPVDPLPTL